MYVFDKVDLGQVYCDSWTSTEKVRQPNANTHDSMYRLVKTTKSHKTYTMLPNTVTFQD